MITRNASRESATLWRNPIQRDMELLRGVFDTHVFAPHFHRTYVLEIIEQGVDVFLCSDELYRATSGSVIFINPFEVHTGQSGGDRPLEYRSVYPTIEQLSEAGARCGYDADERPFFPHRVVRDDDLFEQIRFAHRQLESSDRQSEGHDLLHDALCSAVRRHALPRPDSILRGRQREAILRVRRYMDDEFAGRITNDHLSRIASMSQFHLIRTFRLEMGLTPHEYLINVRIDNARRLLVEGVPIARAAYHTGFFDQSHLTRHFKRLTGVTPGQYSRCAQSGPRAGIGTGLP